MERCSKSALSGRPSPGRLSIDERPSLLEHLLSKFAVEARKVTGEHYPPSTIHQLLCGILRYIRETNPSCLNYHNKQDVRFKPLQNTLDVLFHKLHAEGHRVQVKHAEILTKADKAKLWTSGVLGSTSPILQPYNGYSIIANKMTSKHTQGEVKYLHIQLLVIIIYCAM